MRRRRLRRWRTRLALRLAPWLKPPPTFLGDFSTTAPRASVVVYPPAPTPNGRP